MNPLFELTKDQVLFAFTDTWGISEPFPGLVPPIGTGTKVSEQFIENLTVMVNRRIKETLAALAMQEGSKP